LRFNAERLEKAPASISIESSGDPVRSSPCWGSMRALASNSLQRGWTPLAVTGAHELRAEGKSVLAALLDIQRGWGPALSGEPSSSLQGPGLSTDPHHNFGVHYAPPHSIALGVGTLLEIRVGVLGDKCCHVSRPEPTFECPPSSSRVRRHRAAPESVPLHLRLMYTWTEGDKYCHPMCASCQKFSDGDGHGVGPVSYSKAGELIELATMAAGRHVGVNAKR
jgi:hypothetical protein